MQRLKPGDRASLGEMGISEEEERQARIGVITNVVAFAAIVLALRMGKFILYSRGHEEWSLP